MKTKIRTYSDISGPVIVELILLVETSALGRFVLSEKVRRWRCWRCRCCRWDGSCRRCCCDGRFGRRRSASLSSQSLSVRAQADGAFDIVLFVVDVFLDRSFGNEVLFVVEVSVEFLLHGRHRLFRLVLVRSFATPDGWRREVISNGDSAVVRRFDHDWRPPTFVGVEFGSVDWSLVGIEIVGSWKRNKIGTLITLTVNRNKIVVLII